MAERRAKFEAKFKNVWAVGPTGCSRFRMTFDTKLKGDQIIGDLLADTLVADVELTEDLFTRSVSLAGAEKIRSEGVSIMTGVTSDDRVAELIERVWEKDPEQQKDPGFDMIIMPLVGGSKEYLKWVKLQTMKKDNSASFFNKKSGLQKMEALDNTVSDMKIKGTEHYH